MKFDEIVKYVKGIMKTEFYWDRIENGIFYSEIYVDYRDKELSENTIKEILRSDFPRDKYNELIWEWEMEQREYELDYVVKRVMDMLPDDYLDYAEEIEEWIEDHTCFYYSEDSFSGDVLIDIMIDTGDANHDYTLNCVYPHYNGRYGETIENNAAIVWLAKQQGYSKHQLNKALMDCEYNDSKFLKSMFEEVQNCTTGINALTFLIKLDLLKAIDFVEQIKKSQKNADAYTPQDRGGEGYYIVLDKTTTCMLYDPWNGAGSIMGIELEKDVKIPIKYIDSALVDGGRGYSVQDIYGCYSTEWKETLKESRLKDFDSAKIA